MNSQHENIDPAKKTKMMLRMRVSGLLQYSQRIAAGESLTGSGYTPFSGRMRLLPQYTAAAPGTVTRARFCTGDESVKLVTRPFLKAAPTR